MLPDNEIGIATLNSVSSIFKHNIFCWLRSWGCYLKFYVNNALSAQRCVVMYMLRSQCMICPIHMNTLARLFHAKICLGISFWYFYNGKRVLAFASMLLFFAGACGGKEVCWWPVTVMGKQRNPSLHPGNKYVLCELILNSNSCMKLSGCVGVLVCGGFEKT